jgi:carbamoyl-phosphate synthase large subunit
MYKILTEASGSMTAAYLIKAIQQAGFTAVASDIDPACAGRFLAEDFIQMPKAGQPDLWQTMTAELVKHDVSLVIPSLDETLVEWAKRKAEFARLGIRVILSDAATLSVFQDKWLTYQFFKEIGVPTPATSLEQEYPLVKPRQGRGAKGIRVTTEPVVMAGMISQEVIEGEEYTVDVFCDRASRPVYIIPRTRLAVKDGKSTGGITVDHKEISRWVQKICAQASFIGPVNMQCFLCANGEIRFIEINPRIAGGMALGFAASENWIALLVQHFIRGEEIIPKPVQYGLEMRRYYAEVFIPTSELGRH